MLGIEHMDIINEISKKSEEERLIIIYKLIEFLNIELSNKMELIKGSVISPTVINSSIKLMRDFEIVLGQLYQLENKNIIYEDIENSFSLILR